MEQRQLKQDVPTERQLVREAEDAIRRRLPTSWTAQLALETRAGASRPDATMEVVAPDQANALLMIETKRRVDPRDVSALAAQLDAYARASTPRAATLVVAPFFSRQTRELLELAGIGYVDSTGNIRVQIDRPALYIKETGAANNPWREDRPKQTLKGPAAGRSVRALCDFCPPVGIRELAVRSATPPATISRVTSFLEREALVTRGPRGEVVEVQWDKLIERWVDDYGLTTSNRATSYIEPRGFDALRRKLRDVPWRYAITGSLAAVRVAAIASPRLAVLFVDDRDISAQGLGVRPTDTGANVLLIEPSDPVAYDRTVSVDGLRYAAVSQVAADLLTSPGRGPEEGEELLRWMRLNEDEWRERT